MSRDGLLPSAFGRVHERFRTPHLSTMLTGTVVAIAAGLTPIDVLGQLVSMGTLLAFVLVCIGIVILRRTQPEAVRPFRTPGMPWVPILGALACLLQMLALPLATWIRLFIWMAVGLAVYFGYGHRRAAASRAKYLASDPVGAKWSAPLAVGKKCCALRSVLLRVTRSPLSGRQGGMDGLRSSDGCDGSDRSRCFVCAQCGHDQTNIRASRRWTAGGRPRASPRKTTRHGWRTNWTP